MFNDLYSNTYVLNIHEPLSIEKKILRNSEEGVTEGYQIWNARRCAWPVNLFTSLFACQPISA